MYSGRSRHTTYAVLLLVLAFLSSCATSGFQAGGLKSSIPVAAPAALTEVHSIAVPPFYGDASHWRELAHEALAAAPRLSVMPVQKVDAVSGTFTRELQDAGYEGRIEPLQKLGRRLQTDAVVNGVVLDRGTPELVIQVISSRDGRVLFWQSAEFSIKGDQAVQGQRELIYRMLGPVTELAGTRERKVHSAPAAETHPAAEPKREVETPSKPAQVPKADRRHRPEKKKGPSLPPADDNVSPM